MSLRRACGYVASPYPELQTLLNMSAFKTIILESLQTQLPHLCSYCVHTQVFQAPEPFRRARAMCSRLTSQTPTKVPRLGWWALPSVSHNILSLSLSNLCSINTLHAGVTVVRVVPIEGHPPMCSNTLITPPKPSDILVPQNAANLGNHLEMESASPDGRS